jgi:hypothetical protein
MYMKNHYIQKEIRTEAYTKAKLISLKFVLFSYKLKLVFYQYLIIILIK